MATTSVDRDSIIIYPVLEEEQIMFKVKEDYNLQKLSIGAYKLQILESEKLDHLKDIHHHIVVCNKNYLVVHNAVEGDAMSAVLILLDSVVLKKDQNIFMVTFPRPFKFSVPISVEKEQEEEELEGINNSRMVTEIDQEEIVSSTDIDIEMPEFKIPEPKPSTSKLSVFDRFNVESKQ
ncbi:ORF93 [Agrotis segetum granulovirus]|uniref:ORF93 n=1 Tax=Agrotis segetum granulosis virus TaxID=10464 RepID=Q6QXL3_GVAS|nr:tlp20 [Agrotis segetum granulovirus]AAS82645.1 ORF93 [Agrotis segetum granulovirus]AHN92143.1 tlp20 [Agrotis segetum granulovirus]AKN63380.1 tlp20 [Agrotis segetum granulovirus]